MAKWTDPRLQEFDALLETAGGGGCALTVPLDVPALFGVRGGVPVVASIDGAPYRGSISPYGGAHRLGVLKSIRAAIDKHPGDTVHVRLELDRSERTVEVDPDTERRLVEESLLEAFRAMSYSRQRECAQSIASAKQDSTRADRVARLITALRAGSTSVALPGSAAPRNGRKP